MSRIFEGGAQRPIGLIGIPPSTSRPATHEAYLQLEIERLNHVIMELAQNRPPPPIIIEAPADQGFLLEMFRKPTNRELKQATQWIAQAIHRGTPELFEKEAERIARRILEMRVPLNEPSRFTVLVVNTAFEWAERLPTIALGLAVAYAGLHLSGVIPWINTLINP